MLFEHLHTHNDRVRGASKTIQNELHPDVVRQIEKRKVIIPYRETTPLRSSALTPLVPSISSGAAHVETEHNG